jgi:hypothetical protein
MEREAKRKMGIDVHHSINNSTHKANIYPKDL